MWKIFPLVLIICVSHIYARPKKLMEAKGSANVMAIPDAGNENVKRHWQNWHNNHHNSGSNGSGGHNSHPGWLRGPEETK